MADFPSFGVSLSPSLGLCSGASPEVQLGDLNVQDGDPDVCCFINPMNTIISYLYIVIYSYICHKP